MLKKTKNDYKTITILLFLAIITYATKYVFNIFLSHHLTKEAYGDFTLGLKTFLLASSLLLLGTDKAAQLFLSRYFIQNKTNQIDQYIRWNFYTILKTSLIFISALLLFITTLIFLHLFNIKSIETYHITIYLLLFSPIGACAFLLASYLTSNNNIYLASTFRNFAWIILVIALCLQSSYFFDLIINKKNIVIYLVLSFFILVIIEFIIVAIKTPISIKRMLNNRKQKIFISQDWKNTSRQLISSQIVLSFTMVLDMYLIEIFVHNENSLGEYSALLIIVNFFFIISNSLFIFITPFISSLISENTKELQQKLNKGLVFNGFVNLIILVLIIIFSKPILDSFGQGYFNPVSYTALIILSLSFFLFTNIIPSTQILSYSGNAHHLLKCNIIEIALIIILGIPLTIYGGIIGTATSVMMAVLAKSVMVCIYVKLKTKIKPLGFL